MITPSSAFGTPRAAGRPRQRLRGLLGRLGRDVADARGTRRWHAGKRTGARRRSPALGLRDLEPVQIDVERRQRVVELFDGIRCNIGGELEATAAEILAFVELDLGVLVIRVLGLRVVVRLVVVGVVIVEVARREPRQRELFFFVERKPRREVVARRQRTERRRRSAAA